MLLVCFIACGAFCVLIDTWWNVNVLLQFLLCGLSCRFNRYMVECESFRSGKLFKLWSVLIDTWWNVNLTEKVKKVSVSSFNRYMVECESVRIYTLPDAVCSFNRYMVECESLYVV